MCRPRRREMVTTTSTWRCPQGHEVTSDFCPSDGTKRPATDPSMSEEAGWICPNGHRTAGHYCSIDGTYMTQKFVQLSALQGYTVGDVTCVHGSGQLFTCAWQATGPLGQPIGGNQNYLVATDGQSVVAQGGGSGG